MRGNIEALRNIPVTLKKRKHFKKLKVKSDKEWLKDGQIYVAAGLIKSNILRAMIRSGSSFFNLYWKVIKPFC